MTLKPNTLYKSKIWNTLLIGALGSTSAFAVTGDFKNTDFAAAAPYTYSHTTA